MNFNGFAIGSVTYIRQKPTVIYKGRKNETSLTFVCTLLACFTHSIYAELSYGLRDSVGFGGHGNQSLVFLSQPATIATSLTGQFQKLRRIQNEINAKLALSFSSLEKLCAVLILRVVERKLMLRRDTVNVNYNLKAFSGAINKFVVYQRSHLTLSRAILANQRVTAR